MLKVLIIATSRKTRGGITSVVKAHERCEHWEKYRCCWIETHRDGSIPVKLLYFVTGLFQFLIKVPFYDIVHIHTADYGTEKRKRIFACLAKLFGKKLIVHLHSSGEEFSVGGQFRHLYEYSFKHADKILVLSTSWRDAVLANYDLSVDKVAVLYNPCPHVEPSRMEEREPYILYAGRLSKRKGYCDLLFAFVKIAKDHPEWKLKFAGNGEVAEAKVLAEKLGIQDQIEFLGWVNGKAKDKAFRHASVYCLPSYSEGFPMGVLDAWAYNLPVVTTPVGGILDAGVNGKNLLLFSSGKLDELAQCLETLLSNSELRTKLSAQAAELATKQFNISYIGSKLDEIYQNV